MREVYLKNNLQILFRKNRKAKRIKITVSPDGSVSLTCPLYVSKERAFSFLNENLDWVLKRLERRKKDVDPNIAIFSVEHYQKNKDKARKVVEKKIEHWNGFYNFHFNRISIRNQKNRWGSCSSKGNLNFNYKILFLKKELQDYLIVHELCHLKHLNHSKSFWETVAFTIPDYKGKARLLRSDGSLSG